MIMQKWNAFKGTILMAYTPNFKREYERQKHKWFASSEGAFYGHFRIGTCQFTRIDSAFHTIMKVNLSDNKLFIFIDLKVQFSAQINTEDSIFGIFNGRIQFLSNQIQFKQIFDAIFINTCTNNMKRETFNVSMNTKLLNFFSFELLSDMKEKPKKRNILKFTFSINKPIQNNV